MKAKIILFILILFISFKSTGIAEVINILVHDNNPPFMFKKDGVTQGLYPILLKALFDRMGMETVISAYPWKRVLIMGETSNAAIGGIYKTEEREKKFDYSLPIYTEKLLLYINKQNRFEFKNLKDLKDKRVGVIMGWSYGDDFDRERGKGLFEAIESHNDSINLYRLSFARLDCVIAIDISASIIIQKERYQDKIEPLITPVAMNNTYIVFAKKLNKRNLINKLDCVLEEMKKDNSYNKIIKDYKQIF
ncbi:MAG: transporter substrate-binding domain-containing protein [Desulfobacterales bacterium]|nr:transporter substrate-binding domain-containing protein [Desulfobacterales bacterium]